MLVFMHEMFHDCKSHLRLKTLLIYKLIKLSFAHAYIYLILSQQYNSEYLGKSRYF